MISKNILLDTDFIVSLLVPQDSTHSTAVQRYENIDEESIFHVLEPVLFEVVTVLSRKLPHRLAVEKVKEIRAQSMHVITLSSHEVDDVWKEFYSYRKKNISFVDSANVVMTQKIGGKIASFDKFYPKKMMLV